MNSFCVWRPALLIVVAGALSLTACKKSSDVVTPAGSGTTPPTTGPVTNSTVDNWILANMRALYYWTDKIPANPDTTQAPDAFFNSILYKYDPTLRPDGDRFSWIDPDASHLQASLGGQNLSTGAEFRLYRRSSGTNDVIGVVLYTEHGSPAEKAGLKRGDIFYSINGQNLTTTNYSDLLYGSATSLTYGIATIQNGALVNTSQTKTASAVTLQTDPVYLDSVYTISGKKIGYLVFNEFIAGVYQGNGKTDNTYLQELDNVFGKFKAQGVNELVLDLRYNPGGGGDVAQNLTSLIAPGASPAKVFFTQQYNKNVTAYLQQRNGANFNVVNFLSKANNLGNLSRVFVLTTDHTASASELVINGLKPYMNVAVVGDTTYGKNVGSTTIVDSTGRIKWGIQPIIVKAFNAAGQSDYSGGFAPDAVVLERLPYKPLGDVTEPLLNQALYQITGTRLARVGVQTGTLLPEIASSVSRRAAGSNLVVKLPRSVPATPLK